jgi:hypothetical protein
MYFYEGKLISIYVEKFVIILNYFNLIFYMEKFNY